METKDKVIVGVGVGSLVAMLVVGTFFRNKLKHLKKYGYLGIFLGCLIGNMSIFAPTGLMVTLVGGRFYNVWLVGLCAAFGSILGEILAYNIGAVGQLAIKDKPWFEKVHQHMEKNGFFTILFVTAIPNPIFNIAAGTAGALHYPFWKFMIASFFGNWVQFTITASLGNFSKKVI